MTEQEIMDFASSHGAKWVQRIGSYRGYPVYGPTADPTGKVHLTGEPFCYVDMGDHVYVARRENMMKVIQGLGDENDG